MIIGGQYLFLGIATEIVVEKDKYSNNEIIFEVDKVFDSNLLKITDNDDCVIFTIKLKFFS